MGTQAINCLVAMGSTGLLGLIVRYLFTFVLVCKANKSGRPITISSAHPLALKVEYPQVPVPPATEVPGTRETSRQLGFSLFKKLFRKVKRNGKDQPISR